MSKYEFHNLFPQAGLDDLMVVFDCTSSGEIPLKGAAFKTEDRFLEVEEFLAKGNKDRIDTLKHVCFIDFYARKIFFATNEPGYDNDVLNLQRSFWGYSQQQIFELSFGSINVEDVRFAFSSPLTVNIPSDTPLFDGANLVVESQDGWHFYTHEGCYNAGKTSSPYYDELGARACGLLGDNLYLRHGRDMYRYRPAGDQLIVEKIEFLA